MQDNSIGRLTDKLIDQLPDSPIHRLRKNITVAKCKMQDKLIDQFTN
jgi:hypothetical protein